MKPCTKTLAALLAVLLLASCIAVPVFAATPASAPTTPTVEKREQERPFPTKGFNNTNRYTTAAISPDLMDLKNYNAADIAAVNALITSNIWLSAHYEPNEPWNWHFVTLHCQDYFNPTDVHITGISFYGNSRQNNNIGQDPVETGFENLTGTITVANLPRLTHLSVSSTSLSGVKVHDMPLLEELLVGGNKMLNTLDVQTVPNLQIFACGNNNLTELNTKHLTNVRALDCSENNFKNLDVSGMKNLEVLTARRNTTTVNGRNLNFDTVNVKGCSKLANLFFGDGRLVDGVWVENNSLAVVNTFITEDGKTLKFKKPAVGNIGVFYIPKKSSSAANGCFQLFYKKNISSVVKDKDYDTVKKWSFSPAVTVVDYRDTLSYYTCIKPKAKTTTVSVSLKGGSSTKKITATTQFPQTTVTISVDKSIVIPATAYANTGKPSKITYTSKNDSIATVNKDGKIVGKKPGTTTIVAKAENGKTDKLKVTVLQKTAKTVKVKSVSANVPKTVKVGQRKNVDGKYMPTSATAVKVTFSSNNASVVSVDKGGLLIAKKKGTAVITVKAGSKVNKYTVTVK